MKNNKTKFDRISIWLIVIAVFFAVIAFIFPILLTQFSIVDFTGTGQIGETIGGITSPFIGIASIIVMFLAFYMQYKANEIQKELSLEQNKQFNTELTEQRKQFERDQFENQFFQMLQTHKENISEIFVETIYYSDDEYVKEQQIHKQYIYGRKALEYIIEEINIAYYCKKAIDDNRNSNVTNFKNAYYAVWNGIDIGKSGLNNTLRIYQNNINLYIKNIGTRQTTTKPSISFVLDTFTIEKMKYDISYVPKKNDFVPFQGYSSLLGHYYRHLYQTVKYVVSKDFLTYEEKRSYLRILRAQMSNHEQVLLFYNWLAKYGDKWECETNHFFTDYRMIHNVWQAMIIDDFDLKKIVTEKNPNYLKENNRENDYLFEFQG